MKKIKQAKSKPYKMEEEELSKVSEPSPIMRSIAKLPLQVADFPYKKFQKIADKVPFTQAEWSSILHLSERTMQRYAKDNKNFEGIFVDRILQIDNLINVGLETFDNAASFYDWLTKPKYLLGEKLGFEALYSYQGIQELSDQLHRIQYGVYS